MIKVIKKGTHRAFPPAFGIWWDKKIFRKTIILDKSWRYKVDAEGDISKLWGFGYVNGGHHQDSARFGIRYSPSNDKMEVFSYCYVKGQRIFKPICFVDFDKEYEYIIMSGGDSYRFIIDAFYHVQPHGHDKKLMYALGTYFGGNETPDHDIKTVFR